MEPAHSVFSALKLGRGNNRILARVIRFWEARNIKKGGQLMSLDLLLIDETSTLMHGSIHVNHLLLFQSMLHEGSVYSISGLDVSKSNTRFKLTDFEFSVRFSQSTTLVEVHNPSVAIPKEFFRFRSHAQLLALANTNLELPDIIGAIAYTKAYCNQETEVLERMLVHLRLESGEQVRLSAFDAQASVLNDKLGSKGSETGVMIATNINPKIFAGELYLNATSATKFYFDCQLHATRAFIERFKGKGIDCGVPSEKYHAVQKIEHISIAELNTYVTNSTLQEGEFLCTGEVVEIQSMNGWNYIACSKCSKKMTKHETTLACRHCNSPTAVGNVKFRVEMVVKDAYATSIFVAFDKDMAKLTKVHAATLAIEMDDAANGADIPGPLSAIVGKQYTFHIKLSPFNFTQHHRSFTVSRIFDKAVDVPKPTFSAENHALLPNNNTVVPLSKCNTSTTDPIGSNCEDHIEKKPKLE